MDYGKLAYLNMQDVNKRLSSLEKSSQVVSQSWSVNKTLNASIDNVYSFDIRFFGSDKVTIIGKMRFLSTQNTTADIIIKLNGLVCYVEKIEFLQGEREHFFFFCAHGQVSNVLEVLIQNYKGVLISYDLIISGGNVTGYEQDINLELINRQAKNTVGCKTGNKICCYISSDNLFDFGSNPIVLGEGQDFSICKGFDNTDKTALAVIGDDKVLRFCVLGSFIQEIAQNVLSAALMPIAIGYLIVYIKDNNACYRIVYPTYQVSSEVKISLPDGMYESVRAVFDAPYPMFLFKSIEGKIYLKTDNAVLVSERISYINLSSSPING
jgi:hypothetical protein